MIHSSSIISSADSRILVREEEGWRISSWFRLDLRITVADIQARIQSPLDDEELPEPLWGRMNMRERARRFRREDGLISWRPARIKQVTIDSIDSLGSAAQKSQCLAVEQDLTPIEEAH